MADQSTFLEINDRKKVVRLKFPDNKNEFVVGKGGDSHFKLKKHDLNDEHFRILKDPNSGAWHIQAMQGTDFLVDGSSQRRTTSLLEYDVAVLISNKCIIRLTKRDASFTEKFLGSTSVGGVGIAEYALIFAVPIAIASSIFVLSKPKPTIEPDSALICKIDRTDYADQYKSGSTLFERTRPSQYYSCIAENEAVCDHANSFRGKEAADLRTVARWCRGGVLYKDDPVGLISRSIQIKMSELNAQLAEIKIGTEEHLKLKNEISSLERQEALVSTACFKCNDETLSDLQREACERAENSIGLFKEAKQAWGLDQKQLAESKYQQLRVQSSVQCEAFKAADYKIKEMNGN